MKKRITTFIMIALLFSFLGLTTLAAPSSATLTEDYQALSLNGKTYSRFNISDAETDYQTLDVNVELSPTQQESISEVAFQGNENESLIYVDIAFKDGSSLTAGFVRDDFVDEYINITAGQVDKYVIDFEYPEGNILSVSKNKFYGDKVLLNSNQLEWCDYFSITAATDDVSISVYVGSLLIVEEDYYFVDFKEQNLGNRNDFYPFDYSELQAYKITDSETIERIQAAEDDYYSEDLGFLFDDELGETISAVFLIVVFGIVPGVIFLMFLFLAIRSKTVYKKMFRTIYLVSGFELIVFGIITTFIIMTR